MQRHAGRGHRPAGPPRPERRHLGDDGDGRETFRPFGAGAGKDAHAPRKSKSRGVEI